jgi:GT2 family glycosyltransferase
VILRKEEASRVIRDRLDHLSKIGADRIVLVILTWNSELYVQDCLKSIGTSSVPVATLVVDNASSDGTVGLIQSMPDAPLFIVETGSNLGYAGGNNIGTEIALAAGADVVILINPDAILHEDCIEILSSTLRTEPTAGLVSPAICYANSETIWYAGSEVNLDTGTAFHLEDFAYRNVLPQLPFETDRANGCVLAFRSEIVSNVGLLDERYFLYYEETEWSVRVRNHGLKVLVEPRALAWHELGHGKGDENPTYFYYMTRNRLMLVSQYGRKGVRTALLPSLHGSLWSIRELARSHPRRLWACSCAIFWGYVDFCRHNYGARASSKS